MDFRSTSFDAVAAFLVADRRTIEGLSQGDRRLAEIACLLVVGPGSNEMKEAFRDALNSGVEPALLEISLIHAIGYLGVVVCRTAYATLLAELAENEVPKDHLELSIEEDRGTRERNGARLYDRFDPGRQAAQAARFAPLSSGYYPRAMELSGMVLASPALELRERQVMTVAMLACLGGQEDQLRFHIGVALRNGVDRETLAGILVVVQAYAGMPRANSAAALALDAIQKLP